MKLSKRILSAFLAILMVCSVITVVSAANVTFTDVSGHWAWNGGQIQYLVDKGVLNGYKQANGTYKFMPDGQVTRAEFVKILDETFGLTETAPISYSDVKGSDWFYPYFAKAAAQGYLLNYGTSVNPNGKITREEAISLLVRYLDLPANEKAATTYFSDYYSISENYRDYILRGVAADLTEGSIEGGVRVFKPKSYLTRAEALTILYRAAGCIFNLNAYSRDDGAADTNNVITRGGVILNGISLHGRVLISEGATAGTVSLSGCSVADTLEIRGTADVTLDDCKIKNIIISRGCKLSLLNGTEVENITVYGKSTIGVYSGITLGVLDVGYGADKTNVTGDGLIRKAYINASGFTSSMVPSEFQIGNNLTATFAGSQFQGTSDAQESFSMTPFVTSDSSNYYLNLFPAVDGTVYYYFTNGANAPTSATFDSYYESSSYTGTVNVRSGDILTEKTYSANSVKNFEYVVLQLQDGARKYAPVIIPNTNTDGTGFTTAPYLADETTIKFVAGEAGTLYWYYSESGEKMTQAEFLQNYANADSALKENSSIVSDRTLSLALSTKYLKNYDYVVLLLKNAAGSYYTPVVVSAGDNGFAEEPTLKNVGTVAFKTNVSGELYYYYAEDASLPAPDDFKAEYNRAEYAERLNVTKNRSDSFDYNSERSDDYPFLIIALKNSDGDYMQPVALNIDYRTGFKEGPEVYDETTIRFETEDEGEVMYYYTSDEAAPSVEDFKAAYSNTANKYKDTVDVDDSWERIEYSQMFAQTYPYMAFMFVDDQENEHTPVTIALNATANTGFAINPYINGDAVYFKTEKDGEVWYYFSKDGSTVASSDFEEYYNDVSKSYLYGRVDATSGKVNYFEIDDDVNLGTYSYVVIAFLAEENEDSRKFNYPVVVDVEDADISGTGLVIDGVDENSVAFTTLVDGRLYYFFSEDKPSVSDSNFERRYDDANSSDRGNYGCDEDDEFEETYGAAEGYKYLVLCVAVEDTDGDTIYLNPVVVNLTDYTSTENDDDDSTTSKTGLNVTNIDIRDHVITLEAEYSGEVTVYLYKDGQSGGEIGAFRVSEDDTVEFDYSKQSAALGFLISSGSDVEIVFQLVNDDETYKRVRVPIFE